MQGTVPGTQQVLTLVQPFPGARPGSHARSPSRSAGATPRVNTERGGVGPCYLLQLIHELLVARILAAAGLDQTRAHLLADHFSRVQITEDAGEQMRDVLGAQRGGAQTQQLRLGGWRGRKRGETAGPSPEAVVDVIGIGEGRQPGGLARAADPGQTRGWRPRCPSECVGPRLGRPSVPGLSSLHGN